MVNIDRRIPWCFWKQYLHNFLHLIKTVTSIKASDQKISYCENSQEFKLKFLQKMPLFYSKTRNVDELTTWTLTAAVQVSGPEAWWLICNISISTFKSINNLKIDRVNYSRNHVLRFTRMNVYMMGGWRNVFFTTRIEGYHLIIYNNI